MKPFLKEISEEQRLKNQAKAAETRELAKRYAKDNLKLDFEDELHWRSLAKEAGVRLPVWYESFNTRRVKRLCKALGRDTDWIKECWGVSTLSEIGEKNPTWPMFAIFGLILEDHFE